MIHPIMRYHGAKFRLASWIIQFFPPHTTYVEPFGGAAGVLLQKPRSKSEVYNDLDDEVVNIFRVLQNEKQSNRLQKILLLTPYSRTEFNLSFEPAEDPVEQARRTLIRAFMGFGSAGATKGTTGFRIDSGRHYGTASYLWAEYPDQITFFCKRFRGVLVEKKNGIDVIKNHDRVDTLFYIDPPYVLETRYIKGNKFYKHEMTDDDHENLLKILLDVSGFVVLSGYDNELYNDYLVGWKKQQTSSRISAGRGTKLKIETVWINQAANKCPHQKQLFTNN